MDPKEKKATSKKKYAAIGVILCFVLVIIAGVFFFVLNKKDVDSASTENTANTNNQQFPAMGNRNSMGSRLTGTILSLEEDEFVLDEESGQLAVTMDDSTQFKQYVTASQEDILKVGNTITIKESINSTGATVTLIYTSSATQSGFTGNADSNTTPPTMPDGQVPSDRMAFPTSGPMGNRPDGTDGMLMGLQMGGNTGTIVSFTDTTVTLQTFNSEETTEVDISNVLYVSTQDVTKDNLKEGLRVEVSGTEDGDTVTASRITILL